MKSAVFLDRDGTLIEDRGHIACPSQVRFFPETFTSLRQLAKRFALFMVTNQPGIADGLLTAADVDRVNRYVVAQLASAEIPILGTFVCPHLRDQNCRCIKPNPYHLYRAAEAHGLDLCRSFVVGDHPHDVELAARSGGHGVYVLTGHGARHHQELPPGTVVVEGIAAAVEAILTGRITSAGGDWRQQAALAGWIIGLGGVVAFPTETVYGLGADAFNAQAVARVFQIKKRPRFDPLIVHIAKHDDLRLLVDHVPDAARLLMDRFWPGPLTVVLPKRLMVPDIVTAGLLTVAVRMPDHPVALELIRQARGPIAAPSANPFGGISPTHAEHVRGQLGQEPDLVLDAGPCRVGLESTVVSFCCAKPAILRPGGLPQEDIEAVIGPVEGEPDSARPGHSPGTLPSHYAPRTPLMLTDGVANRIEGRRVGRLCFRRPSHDHGYTATEVLSSSGDLSEAATNLFACLQRLDAMSLELIYAELVPETGLGVAVNDRLRRASHKDRLHRNSSLPNK